MRTRTLLSIVAAIVCTFARAQKVVFQRDLTVTGQLELSTAASCQNGEGNVVITGTAGFRVITEAVAPSGSLVWSNLFNASPYGYPQFVVANSHDVFVAGKIGDAQNGQTDVFINCISSAGSLLWSIIDKKNSNVDALAISANGNLIIAEDGLQSGPLNFELTEYDASTSGIVWQKVQSYGGSYGTFLSLAGDSKGHLYGLINESGVNTDHLISYNEANGLVLWNKPVTTYAPFSYLHAQFLSVLPSGDALVSGSGTSNSGYWQAVFFDRFNAATGSFIFRKEAGSQSGSKNYTITSAPSTDTAGNIYWAGYVATSSFAPVAGKLNAVGGQDYMVMWAGAPIAPWWIRTEPSSGGGAFVASTADPQKVGLMKVSPTGTIEYYKGLPMPPQRWLYIDSKNNPIIAGDSLSPLDDGTYGVTIANGADGDILSTYKAVEIGPVNSRLECAVTDRAGNVYGAGRQGHSPSVTKYSPSGTVIWNRQINETDARWHGDPTSIVLSSRGELAVACSIQETQSPYSVTGLAKLDAGSGAVTWSALETRPSIPNKLVEDSVGDLIVASSSQNFYTLTKYDAHTGGVVWEHAYTESVSLNDLCLCKGDSVLLAVTNANRSLGFTFLKYSSSGTALSSHSFWATDPVTDAVATDIQGNTFEARFDAGQISLCKYDATGAGGPLASYKITNGTPSDCQLIYDASHNSLYLTGTFWPNDCFAWTYRLNPSTGAVIWLDKVDRGFIMPHDSGGRDTYMAIDGWGNVVLAGYSPRFAAQPSDLVLRKLDAATGKVRWSFQYAGTYASPTDYLGSLMVGSDSEPLLLGSTPSPLGTENSLFVKFADTNPPIAHSATYWVKKNATLTLTAPSVLSSDEDAVGATANLVKGPVHAATFSFSTTGALTYKPVANFTGTDAFTYEVHNAYGYSNVATVTINVTN